MRAGAVLTDIEGTTSALAFVADELFPYAQEHIADFVARHRDDAEVIRALHDTRVDAGELDADEARTIEILRAWMRADRKATSLKTLQGLIWIEGYAQTGLRGHVYPDAAAALRRWHADGIKLYVYSSGSILAQKLLFGNSTEGDLSALFSGYFDTTIGPKTASASYTAIAAAIGMIADDILFLSDREAELDAASAADLDVACIAREGETPAGFVSRHPTFVSLADVEIDL